MDDVILLFPKTIVSVQDRLKKLRKKFKLPEGVDPTGANSRLLSPHRFSIFENICMFEKLLARSRHLSQPDQHNYVQIGHKVTIGSQNLQELYFHMCSELDVMYFLDEKQLVGRLLSVDSLLGGRFLGKSVGDKIRHGQQGFRIIEIKVSECF